MKTRWYAATFVALTVAICTSLVFFPGESKLPAAHAQNGEKNSPPTLESLAAEVERLKKVVPDQSHAMHDVDYHFTNLWFAANLENWPLAQFYFNETRSHLRWAVRIIPVRKDAAGREIKLEEILQALENSPLKQLEDAIKAQDQKKFVSAYNFMLTGCYSCHKAADKPYLRPQVPELSATRIINFNPKATTPQ